MKELEYPFDSSFLLQKRRKLKKALLADGSARMEKRIAVLGGSTTNDIVSMLELFLLNCGIQPVFYQSEYAQYWQDAMFDAPELAAFQPDLIFIIPQAATSPKPRFPCPLQNRKYRTHWNGSTPTSPRCGNTSRQHTTAPFCRTTLNCRQRGSWATATGGTATAWCGSSRN